VRPKSEWTITPGAFESLVDGATFAKAQLIIEQTRSELPRNKSDKELLDALRTIFAENGRISTRLIKKSGITPSEGAYKFRFGALTRAYESIGYTGFWRNEWLEKRRRIQALRDDLMKKLVELDPAHVSVEDRGGRKRTRLRANDGRLVSVIAARPFRGYKGKLRWLLKPSKDECHLISLVARLNEEGDAFKDMFVTLPVGKSTGFQISDLDPWLRRGERLFDLKDFSKTVESVQQAGISSDTEATGKRRKLI
jgi:hypothetical protein